TIIDALPLANSVSRILHQDICCRSQSLISHHWLLLLDPLRCDAGRDSPHDFELHRATVLSGSSKRSYVFECRFEEENETNPLSSSDGPQTLQGNGTAIDTTGSSA